jgi:nitroreductase
MDAITALITRRSRRQFGSSPVDKDVLEKAVDAARMAPTARNAQPWEFVAVTREDTLRRLGELADHGGFIAQAPACVAVFCRESKYYLEDGCAAVTQLLVAAHALGIESCWVAGDKKEYAPAVLELLGAPKDMRLVALVALGHAVVSAQTPVKRSLAEVLHWEKF